MQKIKAHTSDIAEENFKKLKALFPHAITETIDEDGEVIRVIDKDILEQEINTRVIDDKSIERYQFTWPGKRGHARLANSSISAALRPCKKESVNFDTTENLYIEGDNLDVLKLLRNTYSNSVKMIYIDPPYNTGKNYIYKNNFYESENSFLEKDGQYDEQGNRLVSNLKTDGRFHTN